MKELKKVETKRLTGSQIESGKEQVKNGKYGICVLAGGQGSRFQTKGPKGAVQLKVLTERRSFFELILKDALEKGIWVYVMTSPKNNIETIEHFKSSKILQENIGNIVFFQQEERQLKNLDGTPLEIDGEVIFDGAGHGSLYKSMMKKGIIKDMEQKGIENIYVTNVDNICSSILDYDFIGESIGIDVSVKTVKRSTDSEKVGLFCKKDNKLNVIEYMEVSDTLKTKKDESGYYLDCCNIMVQIFSLNFIKKAAKIKLPIHVANKRKWGKDFLKEEFFLFDAFNKAKNYKIFEVERNSEFTPIKSPEDVDRAVLHYLNKKIKEKKLEDLVRNILD